MCYFYFVSVPDSWNDLSLLQRVHAAISHFKLVQQRQPEMLLCHQDRFQRESLRSLSEQTFRPIHQRSSLLWWRKQAQQQQQTNIGANEKGNVFRHQSERF